MKIYQNRLFKTLILASALGASFAFAQGTAAPVPTPASASASQASCSLMDPQVFTQNAVNQVLGVLGNDKSQIASNFPAVQLDIQNALSPIIGIDAMSQFVIPAAIWSAASSADKTAFKAEFLQFIIGLYSTPLKNFDNQTIQVYPARVKWATQQRVQINSVIHNPDAGSSADIPVSFILQKNGCNWLFIDFVVDGISALANIQGQIQSILGTMKSPGLSDITAVFIKHKTAS